MLNKLKIDRRLLKQIDISIIIIPILLSAFSTVNIYSAVHNKPELLNNWKLQIIWTIMGLVLVYLISTFDYNILINYAEIIYAASIVLLIFNDVAGKTVNGATGWISIGSRAIQPSEFAKIALIILLAKKIDNMKSNINNVKNFLSLLTYSAITMVLIVIEPDMGMTMVCFFIVFGIFFIAGLDLKVIFGGIFTIVIGIAAVWNTSIMKAYWKERFTSFLNPEKYRISTGLQLIQSKIGIGSGGVFGKGFLNGTQVQGGYIPETHTDFIFAVIGEEWGLIGALVLIILYIVLFCRIIKVAKNSKDIFGKIFCVGIASSFLFSTLQNIGMTIGIMPISGLALPFVSYGGSSMLTGFIGIGIVESISMRRNKINF
ncbi:rod shape-determining protein RodA [Clostridium hydrogenum]|uniref:rod shape-determining protein RodA n=1 Tax=Clostridium hydrogenum TaxID=2855764 RepID=UPI001F2DF718|nr:rod shape-determining protein RodA [Clostridium hydrogenum]